MRRIVKWTAGSLLALVVLVCVALAGFRVSAAYRETVTVERLMPSSGRLVATRSGRIFVQEAGPPDGVPVVLFHGTAAWSELWRPTMQALVAKGFRAIAFDIPPFGFSDRPGTYTRKDQAERVIDMLTALKAERAIIVGHSFGAGAAVETVMRAPEKTRALVLVDAALGLTEKGTANAPDLLQHPWLRETLIAATVTNPLMTETLIKQLIARKGRARHYVELLQRPMARENTTPDFGVWLLYFLGSDPTALSADRDAYGKIDNKVTILWGEEDTVTPLDQARDLQTLLPSAKLVTLPGLGHIPQIEDPDVFIARLVTEVEALR
ncbi:4,5:9,10-diseco-3-hydroxy-5,9, 17-trioxoandrosta-1(10),2-diene-4-oate hydrolase [Variibacter gotjawalensis]|uniref:4,5:9,10-diseco-3-hydroxy-5,9, 17-trioxoandrosta-1(10),2-diene-4-oate hydrolase n=1 Tax=Variibacter gotjawalensis TaxID=1333996 RepID=A0A0S3PT07_9BRAD|nr:alpha/beta hydrolase [Variibacter gotjawalensis]NIK49397.1 pimeloyl-ACP methyl ester carboxylesterase [Variibacter gotjawalensis]RZS51249.1 pimeloyl-ACP methyl ester carboxylesterase [Variibacter gotjawalensis]BAT59082.1 4,5:9,10-diseco-3-hydroxy-5,9, 17-trioxoandrosta-1(10),2-diene-4-oate hydrolase [Variibacter gotjawalensis]